MLALAIAVVIGAATNDVVQGLVNDFIMPVINAISPTKAWQDLRFPQTGAVQFTYGHFLSVLLKFAIVGFICWRLMHESARGYVMEYTTLGRSTLDASLFERRFVLPRDRPAARLMASQQTHARIPAQNCLVVARWPERFGALVPGHRFVEPFGSHF